jgi:single-strand DNA-binding protein
MYLEIKAIGNLGRDPEMRLTPAGKEVTTFSMAATVGYGEHKKTCWLRVTCWGKLAINCNEYLHKGSKVFVSGELSPGDDGSPKIWNKQDGTPATSYEVTANTVRFLDSKQGHGEQVESDDGIPF